MRAVAIALCFSLWAAPGWAQAPEGETHKGGPRPARVQITPARADAEVGQTLKFTATAYDDTDNPIDAKPSAWFAAPFDSGGADQEGNVTVFAPGELRVGAIVNGKTGWATVRVRPQQVARIEIARPAAPLAVGASLRLDATAFTTGGNPRADAEISWVSNTPAIASVDAAGVVTALSPGRAMIQARSGAGTGNVNVDVIANPAARLDVEPRSIAVRTGDVVRFKVSVKNAAGATVAAPAVQWTVGGPGASIESDGAFVAERPGAYIVSAASGNRSATASIVVTPRRAARALELVGRAPLEEFQTLEQWAFGNFLYATSAIAGKLWVYDISSPASPVRVDVLSFDARILNDISVTADGQIGVLTREGASNRKNGIVFLDTSDPAHPKVLSEYTETVSGGVHSAFIDGRYVYLTDDATGSLRVISFEDPKQPKEVGRWEMAAPHAKVFKTASGGEVTGGRYVHDVQVKDGLLYAAYWRHGLVILDVGHGIKGGSPTAPKLVSQLTFNYHELYGPGWLAGAHAVFRYKNYVFVGDEVFPGQFDLVSRDVFPVKGIVHVIDVTDIQHPRKVAFYDVPEGGAHNVWVVDDVLYMGYYNAGARVLDVSGELRGDLYRQGREIAKMWTGDPKGYRPNQPFTWGAQPHNGLIFFNDINSGVWITRLKPKDPEQASPSTSASR